MIVRSEDERLAASIAAQAGDLLVSLRQSGLSGRELGDSGDAEANSLIIGQISANRPGDAILSEESPDDQRRLQAERVWIVDPLDGTREYRTPGRTDWAVHIALWCRGIGLAAAVVALPASGVVFTSATAQLRGGERSGGDGDPLLIAVSASRPQPEAEAVAEANGWRLVHIGSAGAKVMAVLNGEVDAYIHTGGQWEWDSAAPVGVALAAGLHTSRVDGSELVYNQAHPYLPDLLVCRRELARILLDALGAQRLGKSE